MTRQSTKSVYLQTIGCQMNVYDSEQIAARLAGIGYAQTASLEDADLVLVNTCAVRDKAEQKAYSFLGRLARLKRGKPSLMIAVGGCVAQQDGAKAIDRQPHIDLVFGTQAIGRLPRLISRLEKHGGPIVDIGSSDEEPQSVLPVTAGQPISSFVTIMRGCDNYCSYCVVPFVRGREKSRDPQQIIDEIKSLVNRGCKEITLLGQNVNSYGQKEGLCSFVELLRRVHDIEGLLRIRFTTSHPKDFSAELREAFERLPKLCNHIHLPVQSGSNRVLARMNRKYTRELYLDKASKLRDTCPEIAITSDIIVGFPGESEDDFQQTMELMRAVAFDSVFAFKYSDRPYAPAKKFPHKVPAKTKDARLQAVLELQEKITRTKHNALIDTNLTVLVEGISKKQRAARQGAKPMRTQWTGRTASNKIVNFSQQDNLQGDDKIFAGQLVNVRIEKAFSHSLWGRVVNGASTAEGLKGVHSHVA